MKGREEKLERENYWPGGVQSTQSYMLTYSRFKREKH